MAQRVFQTTDISFEGGIESEALPKEGFLRLNAILRVIPVSRSAWWLGVKEGRFPKPVKLGPRTTAWRVEDIRALIRTLGAAK